MFPKAFFQGCKDSGCCTEGFIYIAFIDWMKCLKYFCSEKSWIKSEGQRRKKAPVTYKQKKRKAKKTYTLRSESPSPVNYHDKKDLAASKQKLRRREETLPTLKSAILKLKEIGVPASSNDEAVCIYLEI